MDIVSEGTDRVEKNETNTLTKRLTIPNLIQGLFLLNFRIWGMDTYVTINPYLKRLH